MQHLPEILRIVEASLGADASQALSYAELLAKKLETDGDGGAASKLRRILSRSPYVQMGFADVGPARRVPVDSESRVPLADEVLLAKGEVEVVLEPHPTAVVEEFLRFVRGADALYAAGVGVAPSLLLYGPPGCGKSEVAKLVAAELQFPLLVARTDSLISSYLGSTAKNLRLLFEHARSRRCVLFLDEMDAIAKMRDDQHELGELKRVVVSLLQSMDAAAGQVVVIAATNHPHLLDKAVWRRFAQKLHLKPPSVEAREAIFRKFLGERLVHPRDLVLLARAAEGFTGADIQQVSLDCVRDAVLAGAGKVETTAVLRRILERRLSEEEATSGLMLEQAAKARALDPRVFTFRRLADIFGVSTGRIASLLSSDARGDGEEDGE